MARRPVTPVPMVAAMVLAIAWAGAVLGLLMMLTAPANLLAAVTVTVIFAGFAVRVGQATGDSDRSVRAHQSRMGVYA